MPPKDAAEQGTSGCVGGGDRDRLSGLSDMALAQILSHLKAWEAVRTCVLSKRWRDLWVSARRLDIRQPCECAARESDLDVDVWWRKQNAFAAFVKNLLRRRELQPLDVLRLCWNHKTPDGEANTWIADAVRHNAQEIELSGEHHFTYPSPEYMSFLGGGILKTRLKVLKLIHLSLAATTLTILCSYCTSLEELELKDCIMPDATKIQTTLLKRLTMIKCQIPESFSVYAPNLVSLRSSITIHVVQPVECSEWFLLGPCNLKILKLSYVQLDYASNLRELILCLTSLKELELLHCLVQVQDIQSTSLKRLTLISCKFATGFSVDAPNLIFLLCIRPLQYVPHIKNAGLLVTATVIIDDFYLRDDHQRTQEEADKDESDHGSDFFQCTDSYYYPGRSPDPDRIVSYAKLADEYYEIGPGYFQQDHNQLEEKHGDENHISLGGDDMLSSFSNVITMDLLAHSGKELKWCPYFTNLKTLSLGEWCISHNFNALATILEHSPNLENLSLHLDMVCNRRWQINSSGRSLASTKLKMVKITCSKHDIMVYKLAYFLMNKNKRQDIEISVRLIDCAGILKGGTRSSSLLKCSAKREEAKRAIKQMKIGK